MLKRFLLLAGLLSFASPAFAAGTIPFSLSQQFDSLGHVLAGCQFYTIQAGTTSTPQSAYQDSALTIALPNPQTCDAAGRLPQMFLADGTIKVRLNDRNGVTQVVADNIQVIGASSGGGGGGTVDPTTIFATGDTKSAYGTSALTGWVRLNGRTIGSATSGATERANADTSALFSYLWSADSSLAVSGGRGVSGAADFAANKTIVLPDLRGRVMAGFDDMGATAAGRLTTATMTGSGIGSVSSATETKTLTTPNLPPYTPVVTGSAFTYSKINRNDPGGTGQDFLVALQTSGGANSVTTQAPTGTAQGGTSTAFSIVQPTIFVTTYIKL